MLLDAVFILIAVLLVIYRGQFVRGAARFQERNFGIKCDEKEMRQEQILIIALAGAFIVVTLYRLAAN